MKPKNDDPQNQTLIQATPRSRSESMARLLRENPAILSQFFGLGTHAFLDQFFKLWPSLRREALPYISIPTVFLAIVGWKIGADSIRNPHDEIGNHPIKRGAMATLEGIGFVFPFLLSEIIRFYCEKKDHLNEEGLCIVSDKTFWALFFPAPMVLSGSYIAWNSIAPAQKFLWLSSNKIKKTLIVMIDLCMKILLYSRIFQTLMIHIAEKSNTLVYEAVAAPATLLVLGGEIFKSRHGQKLDVLMNYLMVANLMFYFIVFLQAEFHQKPSETYSLEPQLWAPMLKVLALPLLGVTGCMFSAYHAKHYLEQQEQLPALRASRSYTLPIEREIAESLQDPKKRDAILKTILESEAARATLKATMQEHSHASMGIDGVAGESSESIDNAVEAIMRNPAYVEKIEAMVMQKLGFGEIEEIEDADALKDADQELSALGDFGESSKPVVSTATPLLFVYDSAQPHYGATGSAHASSSSVQVDALGTSSNAANTQETSGLPVATFK